MNIYSLSPDELNNFIEAVNLLRAHGTYDTLSNATTNDARHLHAR
jgi:hypothetical protein